MGGLPEALVVQSAKMLLLVAALIHIRGAQALLLLRMVLHQLLLRTVLLPALFIPVKVAVAVVCRPAQLRAGVVGMVPLLVVAVVAGPPQLARVAVAVMAVVVKS